MDAVRMRRGDMTPARRKSERRADLQRKYAREAGTPSTILPWEHDQLVAHLELLRDAGMSMTHIAQATGYAVSDRTICNILHNGREGSLRSTYNAIMAVECNSPESYGARCSVVGSLRRLQALRANGWPIKSRVLVDMSGIATPMLQVISNGHRRFVFYTTHDRIRRMYEKLELANPLDYGVPPLAITKALTWAAKTNMVPSHAWDADTIDDPDAYPEWTGKCGTAQGYRIHMRDNVGKGEAPTPPIPGPRGYQIDMAALLSDPRVRRMASTLPTRYQKTMLHITGDYTTNTFAVLCAGCRNANSIMLRFPELGYMMGIQEREQRGKYSRGHTKDDY